jgi:hypothetical protein
VGAFGPSIPSDDAGHAWTMPAGREFEVRFPLTSTRPLAGPAGGRCPQSLDEVPTSPQRDCLLTALHVIDGYADPWLAPSVELFVDPAAAGPAPTAGVPPTPKPGPASDPGRTTPLVSRIAFSAAHLAAAAKKGLTLSMRCARACHGNVKVTVEAAVARRARLGKRALTLAHGKFAAGAGATTAVRLRVPRGLAAKVGRLKALPVIVRVQPSEGPAMVAHLTLRR